VKGIKPGVEPERDLPPWTLRPVAICLDRGGFTMARGRFASLHTLILLAWVLSTSGIVLAPRPAFGQSRDELDKRVRALYGAGRYTEAIPLAEQLLRRSETD
jgi:hypothetical protein